ncbi:MAG: cytochrome c [Pseudomonadota bacterium]
MKRMIVVFALGALLSDALFDGAQAAAAIPGQGQGWTGVTRPKDVIAARQEIMEHMEILMKPIDTITVEEVRNVEQLHENAEVLGAILMAVPHLFPPTTNLYDPKIQMPATLALPEIWNNFDSFYSLAAAASKAADAFAVTKGKAPLRAASLKLRASCDACHTLYLRKYESPKVLESDYKFDFESALRRK